MTDYAPPDQYPPAVASPCVECPWRKEAPPGWLGPNGAKQWLRIAHGESAIACHRTVKQSGSWDGAKQCAGAASFRANVAKSPRNPQIADGPARDDVFDSNQEFLDHHAPGEVWVPDDMYANEDDD